MTLKKQPATKKVQIPVSRKFSDQEVVAAINSCFDLTKYNHLPDRVKMRFKELLRKKRVGSVCFMSISGLGLRVYKDEIEGNVEGDILHANPTQNPEKAKVDLDGLWVDCPAKIWEAVLDEVSKPKEKKFLVMDSHGRKWLGDGCDSIEEFEKPRTTHQDPDEDDEGPNEDWYLTVPSTNRGYAKKFTDRALAERYAKAVNGVVVEA